jgi:hypothetical protein
MKDRWSKRWLVCSRERDKRGCAEKSTRRSVRECPRICAKGVMTIRTDGKLFVSGYRGFSRDSGFHPHLTPDLRTSDPLAGRVVRPTETRPVNAACRRRRKSCICLPPAASQINARNPARCQSRASGSASPQAHHCRTRRHRADDETKPIEATRKPRFCAAGREMCHLRKRTDDETKPTAVWERPGRG